ncbi:MAG: hypothetical protein ABI821_06680 [Pseudomonadota bacterium]
MNILHAAAAAMALAGFATSVSAESLTKNETTHNILHFAGPGPRTLEIRTVHGDIDVEAYDGDVVEMTVTKSISARNTNDMEMALQEVRLDTADNAGTVGAIARYRDGMTCGEHLNHSSDHGPTYEVRYDFKVRVPRNTQVTVCTINRGDVSVKGTRGDFMVRSVNGRIDLADMGGSGEATTVNGGITGSFTAAPRADSVFRTINGDLVLKMPATFSADMNMKTFNGGLFTDFDTVPRAMQTVATTQRHDGKFVYEANPYASVRAGNGGPLLTLETLNGDVRILRGAR